MDDSVIPILLFLIVLILVSAIVLPIIAIVVSVRSRTRLNKELAKLRSTPLTTDSVEQVRINDLAPLARAIQGLEDRVERIEATLAGTEIKIQPATPEITRPVISQPKISEAQPPIETPGPPTAPPPSTAPQPTVPVIPRSIQAEQIESVIGRRWIGWIAVALILFATAFFLKYAFDNRWIGELGRVTIGVAAGVTLSVLGFRYHQRKWRVFSQILTGGGIVVLYLSVYASFGYYHLATQKAAFAYTVILIAEAAALALLYRAPAIGVMALIGGFLTPVLLRSDRDQYRSLFGYILALDAGTLALLGHWWGLATLAFFGTHSLFWLWYADNYHPLKLTAVMTFQTAVFLAFLFAHVVRRLRRREQLAFDDVSEFVGNPFDFLSNFEEFGLLVVNAFSFYATAYFFLNPNHHDWMGTMAIGMAIIYAGGTKLLLDRRATTRVELLLMIGVALTFVTLAIPIQLKSNWITIAWTVEGLAILWAGIEINSQRLRAIAHGLFTLALLKLVFWDTPWFNRAPFIPIVNKYFLSSLFITACLFAAALIYQKLGERKQIAARVFQLVLLVAGLVTLWFLMTIETHTYFAARAALQRTPGDYQHEKWLGQTALSVLWSIYAAVLLAIGSIRRVAAIRWVALSLFALAVFKVMLIDIAVLKQLYRIIAFLVLGLLLLIVAWGYHRAFHSKEAST